jgi:DNA adenine methylase
MSSSHTEITRPSRIAPIFRWAGSKRKLLDAIVSRVPPTYSRYVEPFAGSACLFFALRPPAAILNDLNQELIATYSTIRKHPRLVHRAAANWPGTKEFYYQIRDGFQPTDSIVAAARFAYLNRYCFNGVYRANRKGEFNVPMGTQTGDFPPLTSFYRCSIALRKAELRAKDFDECLMNVREDDFVYLDPPYAKQHGRFRGEYGYGAFKASDIDRLLQSLRRIDQAGAKFLLSYSYCREIRPALARWQYKVVLVRRHVAGFAEDRGRVREVLVANYPLA